MLIHHKLRGFCMLASVVIAATACQPPRAPARPAGPQEQTDSSGDDRSDTSERLQTSGQGMHAALLTQRRIVGTSYEQVQITRDGQLLGIDGEGNHLAWLFANDSRPAQATRRAQQEAIITALNARGKVIAVLAERRTLWAVILPPGAEDAVLVKRSFDPDERPQPDQEWALPTPTAYPWNDGERTEWRDGSLALDTSSSDAQLVRAPIAGKAQTFALLWYGLLPVVWQLPDAEPATPQPHFIVPRPQAGRYEHPLTRVELRLMPSSDGLWLRLRSGIGYQPFLKEAAPHLASAADEVPVALGRFDGEAGVLSWQEIVNVPESTYLVPPLGSRVHTVATEGRVVRLLAATGEELCTVHVPRFTANTHVHTSLWSHEELWLAGETHLEQASSGSITAESHGFVLRLNPKTCLAELYSWQGPGRNYVLGLWQTRGSHLALALAGAPRTHDRDRSAVLGLLHFTDGPDTPR